jgi:TPR repeat protein
MKTQTECVYWLAGNCLLIISLVSGCQAERHADRSVLAICASSKLTSHKIEVLTGKAKAGDAIAAGRLSEYYFHVGSDEAKAIKWEAQAATNGLGSAQFNMGQFYSGTIFPGMVDLKKAQYWFGRAADQGDQEAKQKLKELETRGGSSR